jgi:hypothetical protein
MEVYIGINHLKVMENCEKMLCSENSIDNRLFEADSKWPEEKSAESRRNIGNNTAIKLRRTKGAIMFSVARLPQLGDRDFA